MIRETIREHIAEILNGLGIAPVSFVIEHPGSFANGDYATNVAMVLAKALGQNPRELADKIAEGLRVSLDGALVDRVEVAGPGFINVHLSNRFFETTVQDIVNQGLLYGSLKRLGGQKIMIEFTDPNPFKQFHIGHMMSNTIGEALCRLAEWNGAEVKRMVYQGDIGLHVAKAVWGMIQNRAGFPQDDDTLDVKIRFLSNAYAFGSREYEGDERAKKEIEVTNKLLFDRSNKELLIYYEKGRAWSLEAFEKIYERFGTAFDFQVLESEIAEIGKQTVLAGLQKGIFEQSEGAIVYRGEKHGLHTRVFVTSQGLPVYEAKELALPQIKSQLYAYDTSIILTGNEVDEYFKVVLAAMEEVFPELRAKTTHVSHGMLRLSTGKMSSRTGSVVAAEELLEEVRIKVLEKIADRGFDTETQDTVAEKVAIGALKYSVLKQSPGKDIIFNFDTSLSFEGDSGPYLQYTTIRTQSILRVAEEAGVVVGQAVQPSDWVVTDVEKILNRFPEVLMTAYDDLAPQHMVTYLTELASAFNSFYGNHQIVKADDPASPYKVGITQAVHIILVNGLQMLGIPLPEKM
jgi:arginyl-tRNA synthetase